MNNQFHTQNAQLQKLGGPINDSGSDTLSLLEAYNAQLIDVEASTLLFNTDRSDEFTLPVKAGWKILYSKLLDAHQQLIPITVRKADGGYQVLNNEELVEVMLERGYQTITVICIECDEAKTKEVKQELKKLKPHVSFKVSLNAFPEIKEAVKDARKVAKANGEEVPTTDAIISEVLKTSISTVKDMATIAKGDDVDGVAKKLDGGSTIHSVVSKVKKQPEFSICKAPEGYDISVLCPDCPSRAKFMAEMETKRNLVTNQNNQKS